MFNGKLLRIYIGESDRHGAQPLYTFIVELARKRGISGATVLKGIEGYGAHSIVHAARVFDLSSDLPLVIEIIDSEEKIRGFIAEIDTFLSEGLITLENVEVIRYGGGGQE